jgi:predicted Zn-dependent peptidase
MSGFKEEMDIISEELKEWKDDLVQACEDELFANSFSCRRIKELIIGNEKSIKAIDLLTLKRFYKEFYVPGNCVVTVVSSLSMEEVIAIAKKYLGTWQGEYSQKNINFYENNLGGIYIEDKEGINGAKLQFIYPIHELNDEEIKALTLFNLCFGEGTSSLLYDEIRTKRGLVYDIGSYIKNEKGIKLYTITLAASKENIHQVIDIIENIINKVKNSGELFSSEMTEKYEKIIKLKREMRLEKSVELCKNITVYEVMYNSAEKFYNEVENLKSIKSEEIMKVIKRVLVNPSIQIIQPR